MQHMCISQDAKPRQSGRPGPGLCLGLGPTKPCWVICKPSLGRGYLAHREGRGLLRCPQLHLIGLCSELQGNPRGPAHPPPGLLSALNPLPWCPTTVPDPCMQPRPAVTVTSILHGGSGSSPSSLTLLPPHGTHSRELGRWHLEASVAMAFLTGFRALVYKLERTQVERISAPSTPRVLLSTSPAPGPQEDSLGPSTGQEEVCSFAYGLHMICMCLLVGHF